MTSSELSGASIMAHRLLNAVAAVKGTCIALVTLGAGAPRELHDTLSAAISRVRNDLGAVSSTGAADEDLRNSLAALLGSAETISTEGGRSLAPAEMDTLVRIVHRQTDTAYATLIGVVREGVAV